MLKSLQNFIGGSIWLIVCYEDRSNSRFRRHKLQALKQQEAFTRYYFFEIFQTGEVGKRIVCRDGGHHERKLKFSALSFVSSGYTWPADSLDSYSNWFSHCNEFIFEAKSEHSLRTVIQTERYDEANSWFPRLFRGRDYKTPKMIWNVRVKQSTGV